MNTIKKVFSDKDSSAGTSGADLSNNKTVPGTTGGNSTAGTYAIGDHGTQADNATGGRGAATNTSHIVAPPQDDGGHSHASSLAKHALMPEGNQAEHDHRHLAAVTKELQHHHETEEVSRQREVDRHIHHVQHHVQPVLDTKHHDRQHSEKIHEPTKVHEQHVNTDSDHKIFAGLNKHQDTVSKGEHHSKVVDKGEVVNENVSHHVHHVVQPVIERDTHTHHTIHTTIPVHQTTHEAPIIHQSSTHEPMHVKDFLAGGGDLSSKLTHDNAGVLQTGDCSREVQGTGEKIAAKLGLGSHSSTTGASGTTA